MYGIFTTKKSLLRQQYQKLNFIFKFKCSFRCNWQTNRQYKERKDKLWLEETSPKIAAVYLEMRIRVGRFPTFLEFHICTHWRGLLVQYKTLWNWKGVSQSKNHGRTGDFKCAYPPHELKIKILQNTGMLHIKMTALKCWLGIWKLFWKILIQSEISYQNDWFKGEKRPTLLDIHNR